MTEKAGRAGRGQPPRKGRIPAAWSAWAASATVLAAGLAGALVSGHAWAGAAATPAERPPAGRYRCYQPPSYMVTAWFDLEADGTYRLQGGPPARYAFEPATRVVRWLEGGHAGSGLVGLYVPPAGHAASDQATAQRHAIVMTSPKNLRPPKSDRDPRVQCLLTTH